MEIKLEDSYKKKIEELAETYGMTLEEFVLAAISKFYDELDFKR